MGIESIVSVSAFGVFSVSGQLNEVDVKVIIDRSVDIVDEDGNIRRVAAIAHFLKSQLSEWSRGDVLSISSDRYKLRQLISDDGFIVKIEATPSTGSALQFVDGSDMEFVDGSKIGSV